MLPRTRTATKAEILSIPYYDNINSEYYGHIIHRGIDEEGNNVYTLSRQFSGSIVIRALTDLSIILAGDETHVVFVNVSPAVNSAMKIGGFLSRRLHLIWPGRPIVLWGSRRAYMNIVKIVNRTKEKTALNKKSQK
jgi:hypothetical protein